MSVKLFMYGEYRDVTFHMFPAGEIGCQLSEDVLSVLWQWGKKSSCTIEVLFQGSDDMLKVMCLADALREFQPAVKLNLSIPYFPAARADRVMGVGDAFGLRVYASLLKTIHWESIRVVDPHSSVLAGMFHPGVLKVTELCDIWTQENLFSGYRPEKFALIAPDQGAYKKVGSLAEKLGVSVVSCQKLRDSLSSGIRVHIYKDSLEFCLNQGIIDFVVVDDICDGWGTFEAVASSLPLDKVNIHLRVTHGIFSKGLDCLIDYSTIRCQHYLGNDPKIGQKVCVQNN